MFDTDMGHLYGVSDKKKYQLEKYEHVKDIIKHMEFDDNGECINLMASGAFSSEWHPEPFPSFNFENVRYKIVSLSEIDEYYEKKKKFNKFLEQFDWD